MGLFKPISKNQKDYDDYHEANRNINKLIKKKNFNDDDYSKLHEELDNRADAASRVFGVKVNSLFDSEEEAEAFRDKWGKK